MSLIRAARPGQLIVAAFLATIALGTLALMLPVARTGAAPWPATEEFSSLTVPLAGPSIGEGAPLSVALFTATSAASVTGLIVVDTATYWTGFGHAVLLILMEFGGIGTMTVAALVAIVVARRLGLHQRSITAAATGKLHLGDVRRLVVRIFIFAGLSQLAGALIMAVRLAAKGETVPEAVREAIFLAISAFNNAGFSPHTHSLIPHATDPAIIIPVALLIIVGGLGFPVIMELRYHLRDPKHWTLTTRLVLLGTALLIVGGWAALAVTEWDNPATIGGKSVGDKLLISAFSAISPRTAGFNSVDIAQQTDLSWLVTDFLMFVGGGPAGTAGGIKVTTALVIVFIVVTEIRGDGAVNALGRRLSRSTHRVALTVIVLSAGAVVIVTFLLMALTPFELDRTLYEAISAFATVGLSTGITPSLPVSAQTVIVVLMMIGRMGPITVATALVLKSRKTLYELPKDRPLIG
ncbi:ATPase [Bowdeniella nasicola]|uniref:ATPase n=1 Tax=Bowdeniella nasicola TaxID=208480 RepID=A0A1Q5Q1A3_9ACTO|nr:potassium transporter TrkG [Bowdeniella nasicola]OKL53587.1 ATPase [Bowdeniella nasicola]